MEHRVEVTSVGLYHGTRDLDALIGVIGQFWMVPDAVVLDFRRCTFITSAGVAVLCAFKKYRDHKGYETSVDWNTVGEPLKQLQRWRFDTLFGKTIFPFADRAVPLYVQQNLDSKAFVEYIQRAVIEHAGMPKMTEPLAKATRGSFCEVFRNVFDHAASPIGGLAIGQLYPNAKEFQICICDAGVGMAQRVRNVVHGLSSQRDAILWALQQGNSTASRQAPPGLGLYVLRQFVAANEGTFKIYANQACFIELSGTQEEYDMKNAFPGTLVEMRLNVREDVTYGI